MPTYVGPGELEACYDGADEIESIYDGAVEVWSNSGAIYLGFNTVFDIKELLPNVDYTKLTANDFVFSRSDYTQSTDGVNAGYTDSTLFWQEKSYDSSNGILYWNLNGSRGEQRNNPVRAYYVKKPEKMLNIGSAMDIDIKKYIADNNLSINYKNLTTDNFFIVNVPTRGCTFTCYVGSCGFWAGYDKRYDANTGVLHWATISRWEDDGTIGTIYLIPKVR